MSNVHGPHSVMLSNKGEESSDPNEDQNVSLSKEQYEQIMSLQQDFQAGNEGESASSINPINGVVNFACI